MYIYTYIHYTYIPKDNAIFGVMENKINIYLYLYLHKDILKEYTRK